MAVIFSLNDKTQICDSSHHIVRSLESLEESICCEFGSTSHAAQALIATTRKGNLAISDYFVKTETIPDPLFLAGCDVSKDDLITSIFMGLPCEYDVNVAMINNRLKNCDQSRPEVTIQEVLAMSLSQETWIEQQNAILDVNIQDANVNYNDSCGRGRSGRGRTGRGCINGDRGNSWLTCQICKKQGHIAYACWHRLDPINLSRLQQSLHRQLSLELLSSSGVRGLWIHLGTWTLVQPTRSLQHLTTSRSNSTYKGK